MKRSYAILLVAAGLLFGSCRNGDEDDTTQEYGINSGQSGTIIAADNDQGGQTTIPSSGGTSSVQAGTSGGAGGKSGIDAGVKGGDTGESGKDASENDAEVGESGAEASDSGIDAEEIEPTDFESCYASLESECDFAELDTADEISQLACSAIKFISIPLVDGSSYGPVTIQSGPYGGAAIWNAGAGTEFVNPVNIAEVVCIPIGIMTFAQPDPVNQQLYNLRDMDWSLYTIYRPACFKEGEKYPVITWANGTCGEQAGYAALLAVVASHGFVVISSNSTWTATPPTNIVQTRALDYAEALNEDPDSILYQRLDLDKIGAMGHSQGAGATRAAAIDPRIDALILWNAGTSNDKPFLDVSGDGDIGGNTPASMAAAVNASTQPGAWVYTHRTLNTGGVNTGHLVLMEQPDRVWSLAVNWWKYMLKDDPEAKKMFVGDDCGFCNMADEFEYGHNSLLQ
ncbi:MAG: hypothetical protein JXA30_23085 [Deltaproteobacteria bacterium]|nr:hypothetical protein [Deltaproteobacteria bacterium]